MNNTKKLLVVGSIYYKCYIPLFHGHTCIWCNFMNVFRKSVVFSLQSIFSQYPKLLVVHCSAFYKHSYHDILLLDYLTKKFFRIARLSYFFKFHVIFDFTHFFKYTVWYLIFIIFVFKFFITQFLSVKFYNIHSATVHNQLYRHYIMKHYYKLWPRDDSMILALAIIYKTLIYINTVVNIKVFTSTVSPTMRQFCYKSIL